MSNEKKQKDINPQEANAWLQIIITLGNFIKSLFAKKLPKNKVVEPQQPTINIDKDTLKNQNLNN